MSYKLEQPYTEEERANFIVEYNHNQGLLIEETDKALYALEPNEIMFNGEPTINPNYEKEQADIKRKELIQTIYEIKAKKAYGGVIINDLLVFETNQISITSTVASLALMSETSTANWKFYTVEGQPYSQEITKTQLFGIASFGQAMINDCFAVEGQYNERLKEATIEQLNDVEWCEKFIEQVQSTMDEINNKMAVGFGLTE